MEDKKQPIVIKKIIAAHGHHGGSWKVAFADFATAMMAFFMVLWLVGQTDAQKRGGIAEFFQNPSMVRGHSEAPTGSIGPGGAGLSLISFGNAMEVRKQQDIEAVEKIRDGGVAYVSLDKIREQRRLKDLLENLKQEIGQSEALTPFKDQLMLEVIPSGLRIQIIDKKNRPMFEPGSANLMDYTETLLRKIGKTLNKVPNKISISGHTDASKLVRKRGHYTNWELSTDRANAARRAMVAGGMNPNKVARVLGLASTVLYDKENPASPSNRRISIVVMKRELSDLAKLEEETKAQPAELTQGSLNMENVKDDSPLPSESDNLDITDKQRMKHIDSSTRTGRMELELHGLRKESKVESSGGSKLLEFKLHDSSKDNKFKTNTNMDAGGMDLRFHGVRDKDKKEISAPTEINPPAGNRKKERGLLKLGAEGKSNKKEQRGINPEIKIRKRRSVIKLPTVINPNLLPNIRRNRKQ